MQVIPINRTVAAIMNAEAKTPSVQDSAWRLATQKQKDVAMKREQFIRPVCEHVEAGASVNVAVRNVLERLKGASLGDRYLQLACELGRKGNVPGRSTLIEWVQAYRTKGREGLLDKHTGRVRQTRGWEAAAIELYNIPSKPSYTAVALKLREQLGFADATDSAVRRFLKSLPATLGTNSPARVGKHYYSQNHGRYKTRDSGVLMVGEIYEGDGHTVDAYIAHPNTGGPWRPELTIWIDVRSQLIVGWYLSEAESTNSTLFALSHALTRHDHVPAWLHIDNGSGFKAKLMSDTSTGFYDRFGISTCWSIPGNAKGKGLVEGWFGYFRNHHDKFWNGGQDYCGHDQAAETNRRMTDKIRSGARQLLSFEEYKSSVGQFIEAYNARPKKGLQNQAPLALWQQLERTPVELPDEAIIRPMQERTVRRCCVRLHNRFYEHTALQFFDRHEVHVEYDLHDDSRVWIYDDKGRLICLAPLKSKIAWMPESRLEEARERRRKGRLKRIEKKAEMVRAEEASLIDQTHTLDALEQFDALDHDYQPEPIEPASDIELDIDLFDDSYLDD